MPSIATKHDGASVDNVLSMVGDAIPQLAQIRVDMQKQLDEVQSQVTQQQGILSRVIAHLEGSSSHRDLAIDVVSQTKVSGRSSPQPVTHVQVASLRNEVSPSEDSQALSCCHVTTETKEASVHYWGFRQSYWDVAAFLGDRTVFEFAEGVANLCLLMVNIVVQICFIAIVSRIAVSSLDDDTIDGYHKWRSIVGHAFQFMDPVTEKSLTARVCNGDPSLYLSTMQSVQINNIREYLEINFPFNGPMMCTLGMLTWTLTVAREFHVLKDMVQACMSVLQEETVIIEDAGRLVLKSLSRFRFRYILALVALRAVIASTLLIIGIRYLIFTISVEDILLNAVALEFVLNVDELMFEALAPCKTRRFIFLMRPLPLPRTKTWRGLDTTFLIMIFATLTIFSYCIPFWLMEEMDNMRIAEHELCGGFQDFSYSYTGVETVAWEKTNLDPKEAWLERKTTTGYRVLRALIDERDSEDEFVRMMRSPAGLLGPGWSVAGLSSWSVTKFGEQMNGECLDVIYNTHSLRYIALASLRDAFQDQSISSCGDVAKHCNDFFAHYVRLWCPVTCGCDNPNGSLAVPFPENGCPSPCLTSPSYYAVRDQLPCNDTPKDDLIANNSLWTSLIDNILTATSSWLQYREDYHNITETMRAHGCDAAQLIKSTMGNDVCAPSTIKSIQVFCPVACQCARRGLDLFNQCPTTCTQ